MLNYAIKAGDGYTATLWQWLRKQGQLCSHDGNRQYKPIQLVIGT